MILSKRLQVVAGLVTGSSVADIGTDHAYIPIYLVQNEKADKAVAMDINKGPLKRAQENICLNKCENKIDVRLSNGLSELKSREADSIVIAGMGGSLIVKILSEGKNKLEGVSELILQPQSEIFLVRKCLHKEEYCIVQEKMIIDEGKYYVALRAVKGQEKYLKEIEYRYGRLLLDNKNEILKEFLLKEQQIYESLKNNLLDSDSHRAKERLKEIEEELKFIKEGLNYYEM